MIKQYNEQDNKQYKQYDMQHCKYENNENNKIYKAFYNSPIGYIEIKGTKNGVLSVEFCDTACDTEDFVNISEFTEEFPEPIIMCIEQLDEYFKGERHKFSLNIIFAKGTDFQKKVWNALMEIPYGKTASYGQIARAIDNEKAARAVGNANNKNPISIIIPCHRVIGSDGSLVGYGGGLWRKEWLLEHEKTNSI